MRRSAEDQGGARERGKKVESLVVDAFVGRQLG